VIIMTKSILNSALLSFIAVSLLAFAMPVEVIAAPRGGGGQVERGGNASANRNANVNANANANRNTNANVNRNTNVNQNVNVNKNVNVNVDGGYNNNYNNNYHPVARAAAVGATVAVTAAVVGSIVTPAQMPPSCVQVNNGGVVYMQCGSTWYQPQYQGSNVTYVVVNQP
jgi:hypothetical protein